MKKLISKLFATLFTVVFFISCETEKVEIIKEDIDSSPVEYLDGYPFAGKNLNIDEIPDIKEYIFSKAGKDIFKEELIENKKEGVKVDSENVRKTWDENGNINYSFQFDYEGGQSNMFYNLIVGVSSEGIKQEPYVLSYEINEGNFEDFYDNNVPGGMDFSKFNGTINLNPFEYFFPDGNYLKSDCQTHDSNGDPINCEQIIIDGGSSGSSGSGGSYGGVPVSYTTIIYHIIPDGRVYEFGSRSVCQHPGDCLVVMVYNPSTSAMQKSAKADCDSCEVYPTAGVGINYHSAVGALGFKLQLDVTRKLALNEEAQYATKLNHFLIAENHSPASLSFAKELVEGLLDPIEQFAAKMTIDVISYDKIDGPYDSQYYDLINQYVTVDTTDPATINAFAANFAMQCAIIKLENHNWPDWKVYWEASREMVHLLLDVGGLVPVIGEVCDLVNGFIYTIEDDGVNATLSYAAAIPIAGWWATGAKYAKKLVDLGNGSKTTLKWVVQANNIISFGDRGQLAKILKTKGTGNHAHHIIPWEFGNLNIVQQAAKSKNAFHMNEALNGLPFNASNHLLGHQSYNTKVGTILSNISSLNPGMSDLQAYNELTSFANYMENLISSNPNLNLGQIADLISYP
ncbi:hypothetical protein DKG77_12260 [Flagellimonas aquimarina]|uniref:Uncharacterized protein n=1 Tax=Flagellimonas aquimarina TaxID=2201895 RepID=A0A316KXV1_9FLAO|nr:AHH domain-containing protein [Allomuricauda koreensis]PWL38992.1 hypothetical protein DKG77_12260 [Allomuricauda koreensis]